MLEWALNVDDIFFRFLTSDLGEATISCMLLFWIVLCILVGMCEIIGGILEEKRKMYKNNGECQ